MNNVKSSLLTAVLLLSEWSPYNVDMCMAKVAQETENSVTTEFQQYSSGEQDEDKMPQKQWLEDVRETATIPNVMTREGDAQGSHRLWTKKGNVYSFAGPKFEGMSRFRGDNEDYSQPFQNCLMQPYTKTAISVSPTSIKLTFYDAIQEACQFSESDGEPIRPKDNMRTYFGCKEGLATYIGYMGDGGKKLKLKITNNCAHKIYQSIRTNVLTGRYSNGRRFTRAAVGNEADPYAPWRLSHTQTTTINIAENARLNGLSKKEFVKRLLANPKWFVNKNIAPNAPLGKDILYSLDADERKIMFFFLWNTFGLTDTDLAAIQRMAVGHEIKTEEQENTVTTVLQANNEPLRNEAKAEEQRSVTATILQTGNKPSQENQKVYSEQDPAEQMPSYPGGSAALMKFLAENIQYPIVAKENGIEGRVIVSFVVEEDGTLNNITVEKSVDASLDREAVRVIKLMPKWNPGKEKGVPVKVKYMFPITFSA